MFNIVVPTKVMELTRTKISMIYPTCENDVTKYKKSLGELLMKSPTIDHNNFKIIAIMEDLINEHGHEHYCLCRDMNVPNKKKEYTKKILSEAEISDYIEKNFDKVLVYWIVLFGKGPKAKKLIQNTEKIHEQALDQVWYTYFGGIIRKIGDKCLNFNNSHYHLCIVEYPNRTRLIVMIDDHYILQLIDKHDINIPKKEYDQFCMSHHTSYKKSCVLL